LAALEHLEQLLLAPDGINPRVYAIAVRDMVQLPEIKPANVLQRHVSAAISDANEPSVYPAIFLYCSRIENRLERKFAEFSGRVFITADVRVSGEDLAAVDGDAGRIAEALTELLWVNRGQWTEGLAFDGRYEVRFEPVSQAGVNFLQTAAVEIELLGSA
jgi:hypothetical protein